MYQIRSGDGLMQEFLNKKIAETEKEIDRLMTRRQEELGNSINFIENKQLRAQIVAYESVLEHTEA